MQLYADKERVGNNLPTLNPGVLPDEGVIRLHAHRQRGAPREQRQHRRRFAAAAQHIGGTGIARAVLPRIRQPVGTADHDGKRYRTQQVGDQRDDQ